MPVAPSVVHYGVDRGLVHASSRVWSWGELLNPNSLLYRKIPTAISRHDDPAKTPAIERGLSCSPVVDFELPQTTIRCQPPRCHHNHCVWKRGLRLHRTV